MAAAFKIQTLVFHGTDASSASKIVISNRVKENVVGVVGPGLYFWDGSRRMAELWAGERRCKKPSVVSGQLSVSYERMIDYCCPAQRASRTELLDHIWARPAAMEQVKTELLRRVRSTPNESRLNLQGFLVIMLKRFRNSSGREPVLAIRAPVRMTTFAKEQEERLNVEHEFFTWARSQVPAQSKRVFSQDNSILEHVAVMWCVCDYEILKELEALPPVVGGAL